jgi:hypothetical protein
LANKRSPLPSDRVNRHSCPWNRDSGADFHLQAARRS